MNYAPHRTASSAQLDVLAGRGSYEREGEPKGTGAEFDVHGLLRTLLRRKWLIMATALVPVILTFLLVQGMEPKYSAQALLVMNVQQPKVVNLDSVTTTVEPDAPIVGSEVDVLSAPAMIGQVVDRLGLVNDPEFNPVLKEAESGSKGFALSVLSDLGSRVSDFKAWVKFSVGSSPQPQPREDMDMLRTRVIAAVGDRLSVQNDC